MNDPAIQIENISKRYLLGESVRYRTLRESVMNAIRSPWRGRYASWRDELWALRNVSFDVARGEVVGIIGRNGAGKSTLLKILSRITEPSTGQATIRGRVGSLLEVGTGFHPELTGRENIYLNGAILGMKRSEIRGKFDRIVAFADLARFIDTPVKRYSSGMYTRLAFAVAAHLEPEILIVDEVLAVGDAGFQKKCLGKMQDVARGGRTVLFVSHQMAAIQNLCSRAVLLDRGELVAQGEPRDVIRRYLNDVMPSAISSDNLADRTDREGNGEARIVGFHIEDDGGRRVANYLSGMNAVLAFTYQSADGRSLRNVDIGLFVFDSNDNRLFGLFRSFKSELFDAIPPRGVLRCRIPRLPLRPGRYRVQARLKSNEDVVDMLIDGTGYFDVERGDFFGTGHAGWEGPAPMMVDGDWRVGTLDPAHGVKG